MRISIDWLKDFVKTNESVADIADTLTMLGLEAENNIALHGLNDIIVGEVIDRFKHPKADRLNLCKVFDGQNTLPIVCGAPNVDKGQKIAFAPVGAILPGEFKINKAKIRGELSEGMICSEKELNISNEHEGIMVLSKEAIPGQSFLEYLANNTQVLELDITPNRADCFSHYGVARDYAAKKNIKLNPLKYKPLSFKENHASSEISISIDNAQECRRYIAGIVKNVKVKDSPQWLRSRLESIGQRSINNIVDISNYVMMEMGQPTHIFDYDKIGSKKITIRKSTKGEKITTLDEVERSMSGRELLITNGEEPIAVAGIMGGLNSAVTNSTQTVVIESAYFDPPTIRKSAKSLNMSTDASKRFERGADQNASETAFWMIIGLLEKYAEGKWVPGIVDEQPIRYEEQKISIHKANIKKVAGVDIDDDFIQNSLIAIGCKLDYKDSMWICSPPSWRPDLTREIDIIEEVIRFYGYDNIKSNFHYKAIMDHEVVDPHDNINKLINRLNGLGFNQVFNNTLQGKNETTVDEKMTIPVLNPLSDKMTHLRTSLLPGLAKNIDYNIKNGTKNISVFEYGNIFTKNGAGLKNINEKLLLSAAICGFISDATIHQNEPIRADFYAVKGLVVDFINSLNIGKVDISPDSKQKMIYENAYQIKINNKKIGNFGKISSLIIEQQGVDNADIFGFELELNHILKLLDKLNVLFKPIIYFPKIERDINFVIDETVEIGVLINSIEQYNFSNLIKIEPLNIFRDPSLGDNKKSITLNFHFQHTSKTLEDKDVNRVINEIIKVVSKNYSAKLRQL